MKLEAGALEYLVLYLFQNRQRVMLLPEGDAKQGTDTLGQPQIGVGIKQYQDQSRSSSKSPTASFKGMSRICWT